MKICKQCGINKKDKYYYPTNKTRCKQCISENNTARTHLGSPGYIYVITNPAWIGFYKIGQTINLTKRLSNYQTSSPLRDYKYLTTKEVNNMDKAERELLEDLKRLYEVKGEWVVASKVEYILHKMEELQ